MNHFGIIMSISHTISEYLSDLQMRLFLSDAMMGTPSQVLLIILLGLSLILFVYCLYVRRNTISENFTGTENEDGVKRLWVYNKEPYSKVSLVLAAGLVSFITAMATIFVIGILIWGVFWLIKLILWALIIVGWIALVLGILALVFAKEPAGCLPIIIGGLIVAYRATLEEAGESLVNWGFDLMLTANTFHWGIDLFSNYWDLLLLVFFVPMAIFLSIALVIILFNFILISIEFLITKIYNVRRPCPVCGSTDQPHYLVKGDRHPIALRPGVYGIFHQRSPVTSEKLPTMLLNGRWKLERECSSCESRISSDTTGGGQTKTGYGTDVHIGFVGRRDTGKSYLMYRGLGSMMSSSKNMSQIDATRDTQVLPNYNRIVAGNDIQTDNTATYKAIQLIYKTQLRPMPYHLFFYDVAGEKFDLTQKTKSNLQALEFYKNVESLVFVIDPCRLDYTGIPANSKLVSWIDNHNGRHSEKTHLEDTFSVLKEILDKVGRKTKRIDLYFVCVKKDIGYFESVGYSQTPSAAMIEQFIVKEMGMSNVINAAKAEYKTVGFYAVSALRDQSSVDGLFKDLLNKRNVSI